MARAAGAADAGIRACAEGLARGASSRELWGQAVLAMVRAGGDHPRLGHLEIISMGPRSVPTRNPKLETGNPVAATGHALKIELDGRSRGYEAHGAKVASLDPVPPD